MGVHAPSSQRGVANGAHRIRRHKLQTALTDALTLSLSLSFSQSGVSTPSHGRCDGGGVVQGKSAERSTQRCDWASSRQLVSTRRSSSTIRAPRSKPAAGNTHSATCPEGQPRRCSPRRQMVEGAASLSSAIDVRCIHQRQRSARQRAVQNELGFGQAPTHVAIPRPSHSQSYGATTQV
jgi:hypothetical protein